MTLAILADDLTGACDSAVAFARRGLATRVLLAPRPLAVGVSDRADVVAIDADSREVTRRLAVRRTEIAARALRSSETTRLFKKVDSTLRGHVGPEIVACLRAWELPLALLCPAFPATGRWVQGGEIFVDRRGSLGTVARLAGLPDDRRTGHVDLATLRAGADAVEEALRRLARAGTRVVISDADTPGHLTTLVEASSRLAEPVLLAGAGGLASALAERVARDRAGGGTTTWTGATPATATDDGPPWLVVAGSQTEVTRHQIVELARADAEVIELDVDRLLAERGLATRNGRHACDLLSGGITTVLRLIVPPLPDGAPGRGPRLEDRASRALAHACFTAALEASPGGLFLTGGATARACLLRLGVSGLRLESEPLPGIAAGVAIGGRWDGRPVITKAGGFGAPDAIRRLVRPRSPGRVALPPSRHAPPPIA